MKKRVPVFRLIFCLSFFLFGPSAEVRANNFPDFAAGNHTDWRRSPLVSPGREKPVE
ncbi:MAG: hypothetical protein HYU31_01705 [Deltaproteobacteria bacterium]|nr:hypothetical protein [Deltaproteobacteria bacterium]